MSKTLKNRFRCQVNEIRTTLYTVRTLLDPMFPPRSYYYYCYRNHHRYCVRQRQNWVRSITKTLYRTQTHTPKRINIVYHYNIRVFNFFFFLYPSGVWPSYIFQPVPPVFIVCKAYVGTHTHTLHRPKMCVYFYTYLPTTSTSVPHLLATAPALVAQRSYRRFLLTRCSRSSCCCCRRVMCCRRSQVFFIFSFPSRPVAASLRSWIGSIGRPNMRAHALYALVAVHNNNNSMYNTDSKRPFDDDRSTGKLIIICIQNDWCPPLPPPVHNAIGVQCRPVTTPRNRPRYGLIFPATLTRHARTHTQTIVLLY